MCAWVRVYERVRKKRERARRRWIEWRNEWVWVEGWACAWISLFWYQKSECADTGLIRSLKGWNVDIAGLIRYIGKRDPSVRRNFIGLKSTVWSVRYRGDIHQCRRPFGVLHAWDYSVLPAAASRRWGDLDGKTGSPIDLLGPGIHLLQPAGVRAILSETSSFFYAWVLGFCNYRAIR